MLRDALDQRQQREAATFPAIVGAHRDEHVLDRYHQDQRPDEHRQHAEHVERVERQLVMADEAFAERIERACPDIAEDDAGRA